MAEIRIGISGWQYAGWRGVFYPKGLPHRRELEYVGNHLVSVEINGSFYSLQRPDSYRKWAAETPDDFVFAVKGSRFITHMKQLKDIRVPLANFFASGVLLLGRKLGPILWQFPPRMKLNYEKFDEFFALLPRDSYAAAELAREHDEKPKGRVWTEAPVRHKLRYAVEVRNESFITPEFVRLLTRHRIALVFADTAGLWPYTEDVTADFIYIRLHGATELYASGYTDEALDWWADRIRVWSEGGQASDARCVGAECRKRKTRGIYVYFDNDAKVHAPFDAQRLSEKLKSRSRQRADIAAAAG